MKKDVLFSLKSLYRDDLRVTGYRFGSGEPAACIVGFFGLPGFAAVVLMQLFL